jgi:hypothetical protein
MRRGALIQIKSIAARGAEVIAGSGPTFLTQIKVEARIPVVIGPIFIQGKTSDSP